MQGLISREHNKWFVLGSARQVDLNGALYQNCLSLSWSGGCAGLEQRLEWLVRRYPASNGKEAPARRWTLEQPNLCSPIDCSMPGFPALYYLLEFAQIHIHWVSCPLLLLPSIFPSFRVFSNDSALLIRWPKYWSFNFSINPSDEYSVLISFRIDWFVLLTVQGILKSLLEHSVHGFLQMRILECVAILFSRGSSQARDWTHVSCVSCNGRCILYH